MHTMSKSRRQFRCPECGQRYSTRAERDACKRRCKERKRGR